MMPDVADAAHMTVYYSCTFFVSNSLLSLVSRHSSLVSRLSLSLLSVSPHTHVPQTHNKNPPPRHQFPILLSPTSYKHPHHHHTGGFYIVKGVLAFPGLVAMVYLCTGFSYDGNAEAEERHEKVIK